MTNQEIRDKISVIVGDLDILDEVILLEGDEFADGAVGISNDYHVVYDFDKLLSSLEIHQKLSKEEAFSKFSYSVLRTLPYLEKKGKAPIIMYSI